MRPTPPLPPKKEVALALLANSSLFIHLDPRVANVVVPPWFKKQPQLVLQVGLNMPVPIPDLHLDDDGLSCTLSFNRSPFHCMVPWESVYAMVDDEGRAMVWPEDVPPEVQQQVRPKLQEVPDPAAKKEPTKRPKLEEVRGESAGTAKKSRKAKGETAEGRLAAVPPRRVSPAPKPAPARGEAEKPPAPTSPATPDASGAPRKPKRELPPYLRVVK